jgi:hypothetical protein
MLLHCRSLQNFYDKEGKFLESAVAVRTYQL